MAGDRQIHRPIVQVGGGRRSTLSETDLMEYAGVWTDCERPILVRKKKEVKKVPNEAFNFPSFCGC